MPTPRMKQRRVVHKSTAGILKPSQKYLKFLDQCRLGDLIGRVAKDSKHAAGGLVGVDEGWPINAEMSRPADGKVGVGFFNVDRLRILIAG